MCKSQNQINATNSNIHYRHNEDNRAKLFIL